jgi:hypothetical protein
MHTQIIYISLVIYDNLHNPQTLWIQNKQYPESEIQHVNLHYLNEHNWNQLKFS